MKDRPKCELKKSKYCNGKGIMVTTLRNGEMKYSCHPCHWLETYGVENEISKRNWEKKHAK